MDDVLNLPADESINVQDGGDEVITIGLGGGGRRKKGRKGRKQATVHVAVPVPVEPALVIPLDIEVDP